MTAEEWISQFAARIGAEAPSEDQMEAILKLAAVAAHASERTAAPMACWLAGLTGRDLDELIAEAELVGRTS
jgi:ribosomal protein L12E/L44/L45/RPP1/RPP2